MPCLMQMTGPVLDVIYSVKAVPASGGEALVTGFSTRVGGGFNALLAARTCGIDAALGGSLGTGPVANIVAEALKSARISCARAPLAGHDQGCCTVLLEPDGERTFIAWPGAEGQIPAGALDGIDLGGVDWIMVSGYTLHYPDARQALAQWVAALPRGIEVLFDPSPLIAELPEALVAAVVDRADWISANASEAAALTDGAAPEAAAGRLARGRAGAVVRMGARGCLLATGTRSGC
jgi:sugar/nucleoside kinase (ribokinase family)